MPRMRPPPTSACSAALTLSGVRPRSFQRSMMPSTTRDGHFWLSMPSAWMICLIRRSWSSVSRMVKFGFSPTASAWQRRMRAASEWKVPSHQPSTGRPISCADARLHLARRLVGEGDGHDLRTAARLPVISRCAEPRGQHAGLAGAGAGQHQHRAVLRQDSLALPVVEAGEIGKFEVEFEHRFGHGELYTHGPRRLTGQARRLTTGAENPGRSTILQQEMRMPSAAETISLPGAMPGTQRQLRVFSLRRSGRAAQGLSAGRSACRRARRHDDPARALPSCWRRRKTPARSRARSSWCRWPIPWASTRRSTARSWAASSCAPAPISTAPGQILSVVSPMSVRKRLGKDAARECRAGAARAQAADRRIAAGEPDDGAAHRPRPPRL